MFFGKMKRFFEFTNSNKHNKVLYIADNHDSHLFTYVIQLIHAAGVVFLTLSPYCSHRLQPSDRTVFRVLKAYYNEALDNWLKNHPSQTISIYDIPGTLNEVNIWAFSTENFSESSNVLVYTDSDFCSSCDADHILTQTPKNLHFLRL